MRVAWAVVVLSLVFSGCVTEEGPPPDPVPPATGEAPADDDDGSPAGEEMDHSVPSFPPQEEVIPVHWSGSMPAFVMVCAALCHRETLQAGETDLLIERPNTTLRAVSLTLAWDAENALNEELAFEAMVMRTCGHCDANSTLFEGVRGTSPLTLDLTGLDVAITEDHVFHAYVYNPNLYHYERPLLVWGSVEQPLQVDGTLTVVPAVR